MRFSVAAVAPFVAAALLSNAMLRMPLRVEEAVFAAAEVRATELDKTSVDAWIAVHVSPSLIAVTKALPLCTRSAVATEVSQVLSPLFPIN